MRSSRSLGATGNRNACRGGNTLHFHSSNRCDCLYGCPCGDGWGGLVLLAKGLVMARGRGAFFNTVQNKSEEWECRHGTGI